MILFSWVNIHLGFAKLKKDYLIEGLSAHVIDAAQIVPAIAWVSLILFEFAIRLIDARAESSEIASQEASSLSKSKSGLSNPSRGLSFVKRQGAHKNHKNPRHKRMRSEVIV